MTTPQPQQAKGLEGVVVAETRLSKVDGQAGKLTYSGYDILDLARNATFEEVIYLLWYGKLPNQAELDSFKATITAQMPLPPALLEQMQALPRDTHPMAALRTIISLAGLYDPLAEDNSPAANRQKALTLTARMTTAIAAWGRIREGKEPIPPKDEYDLAENYLYMLSGEAPDPTAAEAIARYLILLADHGMNASTFTSRVVTSTDGDMYSAIVAAIGSLKGPKHGGANEMAMRMFFQIAESGLSTAEWFRTHVKEGGERIMGIGHRVYKAPDPRAEILREYSKALAEAGGEGQWYTIAYELEQLARADDYFIERNLYANVDYYSAIVLYMVGVPTDFFTPLFAMSRVAGWTAHIIEQWADNRLIRPKGQYVGEMGLPWVPIADRA